MGEPEPAEGALPDDISEVLITEQEIEARVAEMGAQITADYTGRRPLVVGVLKGVYMFMADLVRAIEIPVSVDFIGITRYDPSAGSGGAVRFVKDVKTSIQGRHVIFVEDIIDTGFSLNYVINSLETRRPASLKLCVLFDKPRTRVFDLEVAYTGFELPDKHVVGYGLDYEGQYRHLPFVGVLKDEAITRRRLPPGAQTPG